MSELIDMDKLGEGKGQDIENMCFAMVEIMVAKDPDMKHWQEKFDSQKLIFDVDMKIDGIEVKFSTIIKHLFDQYDEQVKKAVIQEVGDKFQKLQIETNNVLDQLRTKYGAY